ncbi:MAG TPA: hypothetical protein VM008_15625 [Phycisphaerae bacterium]|nr:hypothetical protein [Phycisphaerae bacterium]
MAVDDDDFENYRLGDAQRRRDGEYDEDDSRDEPDPRDLVPDEMATVRCQDCGKWILEMTHRCPYCKHLQRDRSSRKPFWFMIAMGLAIIVMILMILLGISYR